MTDVQAPGLTGTQKVAVVLMNLEHNRAAEVLKQFTETEAEEIVAEIVRMKRVDAMVADRALTEFHEVATRGTANARGGRDIAVGLLEASFGAERAAGVMNRVASSMAGKAFEFIEAVEPGQIITLLEGELPQTVALVLAHLRPEQASAILSGLDDDVRTEVAHCIATMSSATPEAVRVVADTLKSRAGAVVSTRDAVEIVGGVQPLVDIINRSSVATEKALLDALDERDPELAEEVRSRMLTFADIVKLEKRDVQQVLRGIDAAVLAIAMKGSPETVVEVIRSNLSERNREILDDETKALGPLRLSQVEEARSQIVRAIRDLESEGVITVQRAEEEDYVY
ncbi:flagellar motor switch protein FliG [Salinibacterium sp. dk2585]|uniref:flagellar motor switch protein FliG n=1 Tax=unclassified Salinibacterium TaxID=2632331 RepID=UPI0011C250D7|nr:MULTISPECIES: flagellar motor switch protein FliG [unclassified Salinibacterium]QEE60183.1 flagellar motor switch protein FliG [Salinibacterium sp. dk2585]TXK55255.1 flagellar motor switch protein FliG [Salinibacterium sp. dk5596]